MLREKLLPLLELVAVWQGTSPGSPLRAAVSGRVFLRVLAARCCDLSLPPQPPGRRQPVGPVRSRTIYPQPGTSPSERSLYTRPTGILTAQHPQGQPLGRRGPIASPGACLGSGSRRRGVTETSPRCRAWLSSWLQNRRAHPREVVGEERGCLPARLVPCQA